MPDGDRRIDQAGGELTTVGDLARQVRNLRRWVIALTAVLVLLLLFGCFTAGVSLYGMREFYGVVGEDESISQEQIAETEKEYRDALGADLKSLEVRAVSVDYGDFVGGPFPFAREPEEEALYVEYRLKSSDVLFAGVVSEGPGNLLLPTEGPLGSRMSPDQFGALVEAYEAQSGEPFGGAYRYSDPPYSEGGPSTQVISVDGKDYPTKELWVVVPGVKIEGDEFRPNEAMDGPSEAAIFHEDPKTKTFTYVTTDDSGNWMMW